MHSFQNSNNDLVNSKVKKAIDSLQILEELEATELLNDVLSLNLDLNSIEEYVYIYDQYGPEIFGFVESTSRRHEVSADYIVRSLSQEIRKQFYPNMSR